ncbi:uncharacterized protein LOC135121694 [Zophobas morio]|uniref:uncharacterized protein LOC135121694 n=1 Tax=Zophobas morio TaxID=2755281 RepID=UPI0030834BC2
MKSWINCKKQEAPYPAYSEFCHEDPREKPSECKLCPWRPEDNPNFKPPKKKFHTSSGAKVRRSGLEMEYQEAEVDVDVEEEVAGEQRKGMQCDLRKPPCDPPKDTRCPAPKDKKTKDEKKKKDKKKSVSQFLEDEILGLKTRPAFSLSLSSSDKGEPCKGPCKKFKFPECKQKVKEKEIVEDKCPKKKKKRKIVDCPPEDENKKCVPLRELVGYSLTGGGGNDKEKKKCPEIDLTVFREDREDPCTLKRKGTTKVCPGDLLKKKKRGPKKKASGIITPVESKTKMPQQRKTI